MAVKDAVEKTLESYASVFSDLVNAFVFGGRDVVDPDDLEDAVPRSIYKMEGRVSTQERDVAKFWKGHLFKLAMFGFENQSTVDMTMPVRVMSYDGAAYRRQLDDGKLLFPVITLVLYFGTKHRWNGPTRLKECMEIAPGLDSFVQDYAINVVDLAFLTDEELSRLKSDFRVIARYLCGTRRDPEYDPSGSGGFGETLDHPAETIRLLAAFSGDDRFERATCKVKKGDKTVDAVLDRLINKRIAQGEARGEARGIARGEARGRAQGLAQGRAQGRILGRMGLLAELVRDGMLSASRAAERMGMSEEEFLARIAEEGLTEDGRLFEDD